MRADYFYVAAHVTSGNMRMRTSNGLKTRELMLSLSFEGAQAILRQLCKHHIHAQEHAFRIFKLWPVARAFANEPSLPALSFYLNECGGRPVDPLHMSQ